jgi:hypothetical protein
VLGARCCILHTPRNLPRLTLTHTHTHNHTRTNLAATLSSNTQCTGRTSVVQQCNSVTAHQEHSNSRMRMRYMRCSWLALLALMAVQLQVHVHASSPASPRAQALFVSASPTAQVCMYHNNRHNYTPYTPYTY